MTVQDGIRAHRLVEHQKVESLKAEQGQHQLPLAIAGTCAGVRLNESDRAPMIVLVWISTGYTVSVLTVDRLLIELLCLLPPGILLFHNQKTIRLFSTSSSCIYTIIKNSFIFSN
jgi:hypothetical protein